MSELWLEVTLPVPAEKLDRVCDVLTGNGMTGLVVEEEPVVSESFLELPLGQGDVPFPRYLDALRAIGYHGFLTIEREVGDQPEQDIAAAVHFLKGLI